MWNKILADISDEIAPERMGPREAFEAIETLISELQEIREALDADLARQDREVDDD